MGDEVPPDIDDGISNRTLVQLALDAMPDNSDLRTLVDRLNKLEAANKELKENNESLNKTYDTQRETYADILKTLHGSLDEACTQIDEKDAELEEKDQEIKFLEQEFKTSTELERSRLRTEISELAAKNTALQGDLEKFEDLRKEQSEATSEMQQLRQNIAALKEAQAHEISAVDRRKAEDIDKLKKDMEHKIRETRDTLRSKTKDQLDTTTKRTIMENEQMTTELHFQSRETERLMAKNQQLLDSNMQMKRNLQIHTELEDELARRAQAYQKMIRKAHQKLQLLESQADSTQYQAAPPLEEASLSSEATHDDADLGKEDLLRRDIESLENTVHMLRFEFAKYRRDHPTLTQLQDHSTRLVIAALYDLKQQFDSGNVKADVRHEDERTLYASLSFRHKEVFFRMLLEKLNQSLCSTCVPAGPTQSGSLSTTSLPPIGKASMMGHTVSDGGAGTSFSKFLQSMSHGPNVPQLTVTHSNQATQTTTDLADPCFRQKDSMWFYSLPPETVRGSVRQWGPSAVTKPQRPGAQRQGRAPKSARTAVSPGGSRTPRLHTGSDRSRP